MFELTEELIFEFVTANGAVVVHKLIEYYLHRLQVLNNMGAESSSDIVGTTQNLIEKCLIVLTDISERIMHREEAVKEKQSIFSFDFFDTIEKIFNNSLYKDKESLWHEAAGFLLEMMPLSLKGCQQMKESRAIAAIVNVIMYSENPNTKIYLLECLKQIAEEEESSKYLAEVELVNYNIYPQANRR